MLVVLLSNTYFEVHSFQMRACSVVAEILYVVFNIWINPEQMQILMQVRSHVYMWILHTEEDYSLCNMFHA